MSGYTGTSATRVSSFRGEIVEVLFFAGRFSFVQPRLITKIKAQLIQNKTPPKAPDVELLNHPKENNQFPFAYLCLCTNNDTPTCISK